MSEFSEGYSLTVHRRADKRLEFYIWSLRNVLNLFYKLVYYICISMDHWQLGLATEGAVCRCEVKGSLYDAHVRPRRLDFIVFFKSRLLLEMLCLKSCFWQLSNYLIKRSKDMKVKH